MPMRHLHRFSARLALLWFVLAIGAATASPLVQPRAMQLVCSGGAIKLLIDHGDGLAEASAHQLDCALCLLTDAAPPLSAASGLVIPVAERSLAAPRLPAPLVVRAAAPLPARGPPALS